MREFISEILAIAHSGKFTPYTQGVHVDLPTGETIVVKVEKTSKSIRPIGLRFSRFAFVTEVSAGNVIGVGFGEDSTQFVALQKSIAEGVERAIFKALKNTPYGTANSNGWAAHISRENAMASATDELLERDAVLMHWLRKIPLKEITPCSWPTWLKNWVQSELCLSPRFNQLRTLLSFLGHKPTATTVLLDKDGYAVLSHATASTIDHAIEKALTETCRIAHLSMDVQRRERAKVLGLESELNETISPEDHAMFYAFHSPLPTWIFGEQIDCKNAQKNWRIMQNNYKDVAVKRIKTKFHQTTSGPLVVGFASSDLIQNLYFGRTQDAQTRGLVNVRRLQEVKHEGEINLMPHYVP